MSHTVLIIDDSVIVRKVLSKSLRLADCAVENILEAENGQQALDLLGENDVDLVFLDINMPVMNGVEFMEHLRQIDKFRALPVIVVSTEGGNVRKAELAANDIVAYLRKPVAPEDLKSVVESLFGGGA